MTSQYGPASDKEVQESDGTMKLLMTYVRDVFGSLRQGWNHFWFTPQDPATLSLIRIATGAMLFYTHLVWTSQSSNFFGPGAWLSSDAVNSLGGSSFHWTPFWLAEATGTVWILHGFTLAACAALMFGFQTRLASICAWYMTISYAHRLPTALYGLDQINGFLSMYLMFGDCGARYSVDAYLKKLRFADSAVLSNVRPTVGTNISIRLMQVHLCVLYFFAGISKLQGETWWDGSALWGAIANREYQTIDLTWMVHHPRLINLLTHVTIVWEIMYCATIWNRHTRPLTLFLAIPVHLGIAFSFGMITFGTIMLVANFSFVSPMLVRSLFERNPFPTDSESEESESVVPRPKLLDRPKERSGRGGWR